MQIRRFFSFAFFCVLMVALFAGFSRISQANQQESASLLLQKIDRAVVNCYAIEGTYPPSFEYLKQNYGIQIDDQKYYVDYQIFATNIKPEIRLVERGSAEEAQS